MRYKNTREILEHVQAVHRGLEQKYLGLGAQAGEERVRLLLEYLGRHESHIREALEQYEADASDEILDTWFPHAFDVSIEPDLNRLVGDEANDFDALLRHAVEFDDRIVELYRVLANEAHTERLREVFAALLRMEERGRNTMVRDALMFRED